MTLHIELDPTAEDRLNKEAARQGVAPEAFAKSLIERSLVDRSLVVGPPDTATAELLQKWIDRDKTDDPAELARRDRETEQFMEELNATRRAAGARELFR